MPTRSMFTVSHKISFELHSVFIVVCVTVAVGTSLLSCCLEVAVFSGSAVLPFRCCVTV
jgi:hypothetical protein